MTDSDDLARSVCTAIVGRLGVGYIGTGSGAAYRTLWATSDVDPTERHDMVLSIPPNARVPADATTLLSSAKLGSGRYCLSVLHGNDGRTVDRSGRRGVFQGHTLVGLAGDVRTLLFSFRKLRDLIEFTRNLALSRLASHREPGYGRDSGQPPLSDAVRLWQNAHQSLYTALQARGLEDLGEHAGSKRGDELGQFLVVDSKGLTASHPMTLQRMHGILGRRLLAGPMTPFFLPGKLTHSRETGIVLNPSAQRFKTTYVSSRRRKP